MLILQRIAYYEPQHKAWSSETTTLVHWVRWRPSAEKSENNRRIVAIGKLIVCNVCNGKSYFFKGIYRHKSTIYFYGHIWPFNRSVDGHPTNLGPLPKSFLRIVAPQAEIMELGPIFRTVGGRELCPHLVKHVQL